LDRADVAAMAAFRLMELRAAEALDKEHPQMDTDFSKIYNSSRGGKKKDSPFDNKNNPFLNRGKNPF